MPLLQMHMLAKVSVQCDGHRLNFCGARFGKHIRRRQIRDSKVWKKGLVIDMNQDGELVRTLAYEKRRNGDHGLSATRGWKQLPQGMRLKLRETVPECERHLRHPPSVPIVINIFRPPCRHPSPIPQPIFYRIRPCTCLTPLSS